MRLICKNVAIGRRDGVEIEILSIDQEYQLNPTEHPSTYFIGFILDNSGREHLMTESSLKYWFKELKE